MSQNKSNSIIKMRVNKKKGKELKTKNQLVYVCGSPSTVSLLSRCCCCCPPVKPYNIHNRADTHHDSWGEISTPTVSHHHCHHRQTKNRIFLFFSPFRSGIKNMKINRFPKRIDREIPFIKPTRKSINLDE